MKSLNFILVSPLLTFGNRRMLSISYLCWKTRGDVIFSQETLEGYLYLHKTD